MPSKENIKIMNISVKNTFLLFAVVCVASCNTPAHIKYGFVGDGKTLNTEMFQRAIDECSQKGGGTVSVPAGNYATGTINLKKGVTLHLEKGAVITGSKNFDDYPELQGRKALIFAEFSDDIGVTGEGTVDGNGTAWVFDRDPRDGGRPMLICFYDCKNVTVTGIKMKNAAHWTFRFGRCDGVTVRNVHCEAHANWNNDGFDIESRNVYIADCVLDTGDDAICFKSPDPNFPVENCVVENCEIASTCNFIKFGTSSRGGFRNIQVRNCVLHKCSRSVCYSWEQTLPGVTNTITGISGIALEVVDGGFMENIHISDIVMADVQTPVFIRLGRRNVSDNSWLKDILIENISAASESLIASSITGVPGLRVENVKIHNVFLQLKGGGKEADTNMNVPEMEKSYPENRMFGVMLPAYGFYLRHADNIQFSNIKIQTTTTTDERHVFVADDVANLEIKNSILQPPSSGKSVVYLRSCKNVRLINNKLCLEPMDTDCTAKLTDGEDTPDSEVEIRYYFTNIRWRG